MSAYIMQNEDIETIGKFVDQQRGLQLDERGLWVYRKERPNYFDNYMSGQRVAELLMRENVRSVNYRYNERTHVPKVSVANIMGVVKVAEARELLSRWRYQACERNDFERSEAFTAYVSLIELVADVACKELSIHDANA